MIKLPHKGNCKLKDFTKALKVGHYVYLEFMNYKSSGPSYYNGKKHTRDMTPRPKILKVIDSNNLKISYTQNAEGEWKTIDELFDEDLCRQNQWLGQVQKPLKINYKSFNIWSWFQRDEIRNIRVMTREELLKEYIMELL